MHIFVDESGSFDGYHAGSIAAVGGLVVPDRKLRALERRFSTLRKAFPAQSGEIKGRNLNEHEISQIVILLIRHDAIFEVVILDMSIHEKDDVLRFKEKHVTGQRIRNRKVNPLAQTLVTSITDKIANISTNLYLQMIATYELIDIIMRHAPTYYVQRYPSELGSFSWVYDGKDPTRITRAFPTYTNSYPELTM